MTWKWTAPDGSFMLLDDEIPCTVETRLTNLRCWYNMKIAPFQRLRDIAEFEIITGTSFETGEPLTAELA